MAGTIAFSDLHSDLPFACLSACHDPVQDECESAQLYCTDLHSAHVDELFTPHACLADTFGKNGSYQQYPDFFASADFKYYQYPLCYRTRYGI